jgi:hypothetical protein
MFEETRVINSYRLLYGCVLIFEIVKNVNTGMKGLYPKLKEASVRIARRSLALIQRPGPSWLLKVEGLKS